MKLFNQLPPPLSLSLSSFHSFNAPTISKKKPLYA